MSIRPFPANKTCHDFMRDGGQPIPDSDISGVGVIVAFTLSAYLTFALVLSAYLSGQVDGSLLNTVDTEVFRIRPLSKRPQGSKPERFRISLALRQAILSLSDQQIVTGIAIMAAGFQGLRLGGMDSYHYQTVIFLAWMSSSVHLSALSILAPVLRARPALKVWRLVGMLVLLALLIVGLVPTASNDWGLVTWDGMLPANTGWGVPAVCFWGETWGDGVNPDAVLGFLILFISYGWKVGGLFDCVCFAYQRWVRYHVQWAFERMLAHTAKRYSRAHPRHRMSRLGWLVAHRIVISIWLPLFAILETLASFSMAIWISCLGLIFGTLQIAIPRQQNQPILGANENTWGFGQLVPLILLIQPFSVVWENLIIDPKSAQEEGLDDGPAQATTESPTARKPSLQETNAQEVRQPTNLLQQLVFYEPVRPASRVRFQPTVIEQIFLGSRIFYINVYLTQPAIVTAAVVAFHTDAEWIGYSTTGNWTFFCFVLAGYVGLAWLLTLFLVPWDRVGRKSNAWRPSYTTACAESAEAEEGIDLSLAHTTPMTQPT